MSTTDFKTLGRLGTADTLTGGTLRRRAGLRGARTVRRRSPAVRALPSLQLVGLGVLAVLLVLFAIGTVAQRQLDEPAPTASILPSMDPLLEASLLAGGTQVAPTGTRTLIPGGGEASGVVEVPTAFAAFEDLALHLPASMTEGVVYTEADAVDMLPLAPVGTMAGNDNPAAYQPGTQFEAGVAYHVDAPISGVRPATGQARVLVAPGADVLAPVAGQVVAVDQYSTADGGRDWRVVIQPSARPDVHVVVRRLDVPQVVVGQDVTVGQTALGVVRAQTPTPTPANPLGLPSIWISARPAIDDAAVDPYAPAVTPTSTTG